jgi:hypothetical protein
MQEQKVFFRMCQPNINLRWVSMIRLTEATSSKSLTNSILCDTSKALAQVPNLHAQISVLPYQITTETPSETKTQLFSNMGFTFDGTYNKKFKVVKLLLLPQPPLRARTDARTNPSVQRATQLRSVLARVYAVLRQNQITTTVP